MKLRQIKPELEMYHPGCAWVVQHLIENDLVQRPHWIQIVMGYQTGSCPPGRECSASVEGLSPMLCSNAQPLAPTNSH